MELLFRGCNDDDDNSRKKQRFLIERGGYYDSMQVWEAAQPACLLLSTRDLPSPQPSQQEATPKYPGRLARIPVGAHHDEAAATAVT